MDGPAKPIDPSAELAGANFGDARLTSRGVGIVSALMGAPDASFPKAMETAAALEGFYRFISNQRVTVDAVLKPHCESTRARAAAVGEVLAIHDTTEIVPDGCVGGSGFVELTGARHGFIAHFSLVVSVDGLCPLGVGRLSFVDRKPKLPGKQKKHWRKRWSDPDKESLRWALGAQEVQASLGPACSVIHVMDREADSYEVFDTLASKELNFVIRLTHDRRVKAPDPEYISDVLDARPHMVEREVQLSGRKAAGLKDKDRKHPAREMRVARLAIRSATVEIKRPGQLPNSLPASQKLNVVRVDELDPPAGAVPVVWNLVTSLPIATAEQVARVVDIYRARWLIEEYFKALKTGCAIEKRSLESFKTASTALALFVPLAIQLLQLRYLSRHHPTAPAATVFSTEQMAVIRHHAASDRRLPPRASIRHAMLAVAGFGGHIKSNGDPGWQVLGRGYLRLCEYLERSTLALRLETARTSSRRGSQTM